MRSFRSVFFSRLHCCQQTPLLQNFHQKSLLKHRCYWAIYFDVLVEPFVPKEQNNDSSSPIQINILHTVAKSSKTYCRSYVSDLGCFILNAKAYCLLTVTAPMATFHLLYFSIIPLAKGHTVMHTH